MGKGVAADFTDYTDGAPLKPLTRAIRVIREIRGYSFPALVVVVHQFVFFMLLFAMNLSRLLPGGIQMRLPRTFGTHRTQRYQLLQILVLAGWAGRRR